MSNATNATTAAPTNESGVDAVNDSLGIFNGSDGFTFNDEVAEEGTLGFRIVEAQTNGHAISC